MTNKSRIILALALTLLPSLLAVFFRSIDVHAVLNMISIGGLYFGVTYLLENSTIKRTIYYRLSCFFIAIVIIGVMFKVQHWPYGSEIILTGGVAIVVTYVVRFAKKLQKKFPDYLKLMVVVLLIFGKLLKLYHYYFGNETLMLADLCFILLMFYYLWKEFKNKESVNKNGID